MEAETWRSRVGVRITVTLTFAVAVLSIATGVSNIGFTAASAQNLFGGQIPAWAQEAAGFTGTLTGFLMLASALGMRRSLRVAWYSTVLLLPLTRCKGWSSRVPTRSRWSWSRWPRSRSCSRPAAGLSAR